MRLAAVRWFRPAVRVAAGVALPAVVLVAPGLAGATGSQASGLVHGCVNHKTGALTIPAGTGNCKPGTRSISWKATGPAGPAGTPGWGLVVPGTSFAQSVAFVIFDGQHLWASDETSNRVIEVDPGTAAIMRTLTARQYGFSQPERLTSGGGDVWVFNSGDNSVTELRASDGAFVRRLSGRRYGFTESGQMVASGGHLWVTDPAGNSVTEISASTGAIERKLTGGKYGFNGPTAMDFAAGRLWVGNQAGNSVTEINPGSGALVRKIDGIPGPVVLVSSGDQLWVLGGNIDEPRGTAVEVNARSGAVLRRIGGATLNLGFPEEATFGNGKLWIGDNRSAEEIDPSTGTFVRKVPIFSIGDEIDTPDGLAFDGKHVWMSAFFGLTEFPADGPADPGPSISGCVAGQSRALTIRAAGASCGRGSAAIGWLRNGPAGPPGPGGWAGVISGASYGFDGPNSVTAASGGLWVTNAHGNSVTEINPADGSLLRRLAGRRYGFSAPVAGVANGNRLWVANLDGKSVTEINTLNGNVVRVISGAKYGFSQPIALTYEDGDLWVANSGGNSVTQFNAGSGNLVRVISAPADKLSQPVAITTDGVDIWVASSGSHSVTELDASNGLLVRTLTDGYDFGSVDGIAAAGGNIWVTNKADCTVSELSSADGSLIRAEQVCGDLSQDGPVGIAGDGTDVWVAEAGTKAAVTELDTTTGNVVRQIQGDGDGFDFNSVFPKGLVSAGGHVWVANPGSDSVTELPQSSAVPVPDTSVHACVKAKTRAVTVPAAGSACPAGASALTWNVPGPAGPGTGSDLEPVLSGAQYQFNEPDSLATDGTDLFVANTGGNSVTEIDGRDGSLVRNLKGPGYAFSQPNGLVLEDGHLWVANAGGNSVTEISASDGSVEQVVQGPGYSFSAPSALAFDGSHIWVANAGTVAHGGSSVTEINASDGSFVRNVSGSVYEFSNPAALAFDGSDIWVANKFGASVTEISAADGSLIRVVGGQGSGISSLPSTLFFDGSHLWVGGQGLAEISASNGSLVTAVDQCGLGLASDGTHLWDACNGVHELNLADGTVTGPPGDADDLGVSRAAAVAIAGGHVWTATFDDTLAELPGG